MPLPPKDYPEKKKKNPQKTGQKTPIQTCHKEMLISSDFWKMFKNSFHFLTSLTFPYNPGQIKPGNIFS